MANRKHGIISDHQEQGRTVPNVRTGKQVKRNTDTARYGETNKLALRQVEGQLCFNSAQIVRYWHIGQRNHLLGASGQLGPRSSFCLTGRCLLSGGLRRLKARLSGPPILGVVPLDRAVDIFLKGGFVFDTLGDLPELFV